MASVLSRTGQHVSRDASRNPGASLPAHARTSHLASDPGGDVARETAPITVVLMAEHSGRSPSLRGLLDVEDDMTWWRKHPELATATRASTTSVPQVLVLTSACRTDDDRDDRAAARAGTGTEIVVLTMHQSPLCRAADARRGCRSGSCSRTGPARAARGDPPRGAWGGVCQRKRRRRVERASAGRRRGCAQFTRDRDPPTDRARSHERGDRGEAACVAAHRRDVSRPHLTASLV